MAGMASGRAMRTAFRLGVAAVRAYRQAIVALWLVSLLLIAAYYRVPGMAEFLAPVGEWAANSGVVGAFAVCGFFCGVMPYCVYRLSRNRPPHALRTAVAQAVWCGCCGVVCNWFFAVQSTWFGAGHDLLTVLTKTAVDQFGWTVLVIAPANALFHAVLVGGLVSEGRRTTLRVFVTRAYLPNLIMNWFVGIPGNLLVYSLPLALQVVALGFISSAWAVICVGIGCRFVRDETCATRA